MKLEKVEHLHYQKDTEDSNFQTYIDKNGDPVTITPKKTAFDEKFKAYFLPSNKIVADAEFWSFVDTDFKTGIFKAGTFSVITGQQKTRKTFFLSILASSWIARNTKIVNIISSPPDHKRTCLYFDTEQSESSAQRVQKRTLKLANLESSEDFFYFNMQGEEISDQVDFIFQCIERIENVGLVIIDGIADLLESINDEVNAKKLHRLIEKTVKEKKIHIVYVLHFNKGSEYVSGWVGSHGVRKADCVIKLSKCKELPNKRSIVTCMDLRDSQNFNDFSFEINEEGLPFAIENYKKPARLPIELIFNRETLAMILKTSHMANIPLTEFKENLEMALKRVGKENSIDVDFTQIRFKNFIDYLKIENIILIDAKGVKKEIKLNTKHLIFNPYKQTEFPV